MKAYFNEKEQLIIEPESHTEAIAIKYWFLDKTKFSQLSLDNILIKSYNEDK